MTGKVDPKARSFRFRGIKNQSLASLHPEKQSLFDLAIRFQKHCKDYPTASYLDPIHLTLQDIYKPGVHSSSQEKSEAATISSKATDLVNRFDDLRNVVSLALERLDQADSRIAVFVGKHRKRTSPYLEENERKEWFGDAERYLVELEGMVERIEEALRLGLEKEEVDERSKQRMGLRNESDVGKFGEGLGLSEV